jgi:hypothetical protein
MKFLPSETTVSEGSIIGLTLTTHRVRYDQRASGVSQIIGITLDAVSSCGVVSKSYPILLLLAVVAAGFGALQGPAQDSGDRSFTYGLFLAAVLVAAYFLSRTVVLAISSPGQSITISAQGVKPDALFAFVDDVEQAKLKYLGKITE